MLMLQGLAALLASAAPTVLILDSEDAVSRERYKHPTMLLMIHSPYDATCRISTPYYQKLANAWTRGATKEKPSNVTFAMAEEDKVPFLFKEHFGERAPVPGYLLYFEGMVSPIKYTGGISPSAIREWLHKQKAVQPVEAHTINELRKAVHDHKNGLAIVGFLTEAQRSRRLLEVAARGAQVNGAVVYGDAALARELGATVSAEPCVVVVRKDSTRWPLLRGPLTQVAVQSFARERVMPEVIPMGDHDNDFSMIVRGHPLKLHVLLMHRSGKDGPHAPSDEALEVFKDVAERHDGKALFVSYDFFDNPPDAFAIFKVTVNELPAAIAVHGRGSMEETVWRLPYGRGGGGEGGTIEASDLEDMLKRANSDLGRRKKGKLSVGEQQRILEMSDGFWNDYDENDLVREEDDEDVEKENWHDEV